MQFKRLLLMCSALITITCAFPTGTEKENRTATSIPQRETAHTKENKSPLVFIMEERNPKSDSVIVQFVYSSNRGNSIIGSKGSDKDKYTVDHQTKKEMPEKKSNISEKGKEKSEQELKRKHMIEQVTTTEPKPNSTKVIQMTAETSSMITEEISPLTGKFPKYLYDALNPVQPFPELEFRKPNQMSTVKVQSKNADSYLPYAAKEKKEALNVAGPQLSPLSMYDREFNVPIFV